MKRVQKYIKEIRSATKRIPCILTEYNPRGKGVEEIDTDRIYSRQDKPKSSCKIIMTISTTLKSQILLAATNDRILGWVLIIHVEKGLGI